MRARLSSLRIPSGVSQVDTVAGDKVVTSKPFMILIIFFLLINRSTENLFSSILVHIMFQLTIARLSGRIALYNCEGAAEVVEADLIAGNGIVHTIDTII